VPALTEKDKSDLEFACQLGVDFIALSFVQTKADVEEARSLMKGRGRLVSKIEKPASIENLEEIVEASDGVMVARGDLGVEYPPELVPILQRRVIRSCRRAGKPVIVATHMLESMVESASPTRAEASDVATAVYQGTDAVMLSSETAVGRHPATAVAIMDRIVKAVEADKEYSRSSASFAPTEDLLKLDSDVIAQALSKMAEVHDCDAIFVSTSHYSVVSRFSRYRPQNRLIVHTQDETKLGHMTLCWGIESLETAGDVKKATLTQMVKDKLGDTCKSVACAFQDLNEQGELRWVIEVIEL
jgi:pyruvate kinase